jgi:hypothetical protein
VGLPHFVISTFHQRIRGQHSTRLELADPSLDIGYSPFRELLCRSATGINENFAVFSLQRSWRCGRARDSNG